MARPAAVPDPNKPKESKADAFKRLGIDRTRKAIQRVEIIAKLANTAQYAYTQEQADAIVNALQEKVNMVKKAFAEKKVPKALGFDL